MKRVCVYCGSRDGTLPAYGEAARRLGETLVRRKISLVYGGMKAGRAERSRPSQLRAGARSRASFRAFSPTGARPMRS
ncbi:MAG: hypothetical protein ACE5FC_11070 [Myxococcota bacterium]